MGRIDQRDDDVVVIFPKIHFPFSQFPSKIKVYMYLIHLVFTSTPLTYKNQTNATKLNDHEHITLC